MVKQFSAFAPATISNVACGFDVFGFAIDGPGDIVTARFSDKPGITISAISGDEGRLPLKTMSNTAGIAANHLMNTIKSAVGIDLQITKKMPFSSGLGSSAASAAAAVTAINALLDYPLKHEELLPSVVEAERALCGSSHADNAAPALLGGFILVRSTEPLDYIKVPLPENLHYALVHPKIEINTNDARKALPKQIDLFTAVKQWANTAALVQALNSSDFGLLGRSMVDYVAEPVRAKMVSHYQEVKETALANGAVAFTISGSGPAMFAFSDNADKAEKIASAMNTVYNKYDIENTVYSGKIKHDGTTLIRE